MQRLAKFRVAAMSAALVLGLVAQPALAYDWDVQTTVSVLEGSYMPNSVAFQINVPAGTCAAGSWIWWNAQGADEAKQIANVQAVFSLLLTAKMSNKTIEIYGSNSGCTIQFIHILN